MLGDQLGDLLVGIVQVSEDPGPRRTDLNTGRLQACMDAMMAEVALLDDGHQGVDVSRIVGTGGQAVFAADAAVLVDDDDAVFPFPGRLDRTIDDTGRVIALIAEAREKVPRDVRVSSLFDDLDPGAKYT